MDTIFLQHPRVQTHRSIDITPMPWWRRTARAALALLIFVAAVPLLWLLGGLFVLALLGGAAALLAAGMGPMWRRDPAVRRPEDITPTSAPDSAK